MLAAREDGRLMSRKKNTFPEPRMIKRFYRQVGGKKTKKNG